MNVKIVIYSKLDKITRKMGSLFSKKSDDIISVIIKNRERDPLSFEKERELSEYNIEDIRRDVEIAKSINYTILLARPMLDILPVEIWIMIFSYFPYYEYASGYFMYGKGLHESIPDRCVNMVNELKFMSQLVPYDLSTINRRWCRSSKEHLLFIQLYGRDELRELIESIDLSQINSAIYNESYNIFTGIMTFEIARRKQKCENFS